VAGKQDRQRKLARERYERRQAREANRQRRARRAAQWAAGAVVLLVLAGIVAFTVVHLTSSNASASSKLTPSASPSLSASASASPSPTSSGTPTTCTYTPSPPASRKVGLPPAKPDLKATYQATIKTNRGDIVINLLNSKAPCTVNSFVHLASKSYFSNTNCHRLVTSGIFVLQCGDPTGSGSGGPGYRFADENLAGATYPAGIVAMAHTSAPDSNGSQFFFVYKNTPLPPSYTPFGTIVAGLNVIQKVAAAGTDSKTGDGHPKEKVVIESVTIKKT
jgi:peptidyl-prolyl cis-trans isomerase B (cyclophilin B)